MRTKTLNIKYALIQGLYFVPFCGVFGFANNYLQYAGIKNTFIIGIILAIGNILTTLIAPILASVIDRLHLSVNKTIVTITGALIAAFIAMMVFVKVNILTAILFVLIFLGIQCMMPLMNAMAFLFENYGIKLSYGLARGIGSAAYAFSALGLGMLAPQYIPVPCMVALALMIPVVLTFNVKGEKTVAETQSEEVVATSTADFIKNYTTFFLFLGGFILVFADHTIINTYMLDVMKNILNSESAASHAMGTAVFVGAILELVAMFSLDHVKEKISVTNLLKFSAIMFTVKHIITAIATNMAMIYVAQVMQMFAYGIFVPASVYYVNELFSKSDAIKGQSLVTTSMTAAGVLANLLGGLLINVMNVHSTLLVGAGISLAGTIIMLLTIKKPQLTNTH